MDEMFGIALVLGLVGLIVGGSICGIVAVINLSRLGKRLTLLESKFMRLKIASRERAPAPTPPSSLRPVAGAPPPAPVAAKAAPPAEVAAPSEPPGPPPEAPPAAPVAKEAEMSPAAPRSVPPVSPQPKGISLELMLGGKWLLWVGMLLSLIGVGLFLKYAYDNAWIGPAGRLAIGTVAGIVALGFGERFRRKDWAVLFQTLTGGGIAIFYICIFFSFQVYHLSGQELSMILATLVTVLAVVMAVANNAVSIAILAMIGGFLSPVLLSTGQNHPYALFTYIIILDFVAIGAAYFRRWRALDLLSFVGTALIYQAWYTKFYGAPDEPSQLLPALLYTSLFYLMFLLVPSMHSLVRGLAGTVEGVVLVVANAVFSFYCYYNVLFDDYRHALGFVVLGQAALVFLLFQVWLKRVGKQEQMGESLLVIALALVTIAIPIQLKLYAVPIAWALEGVLFVYLGIRFRRALVKAGGVVALFLAAWGLLERLPLHRLPFTAVFNVPFGSWVVVIAAAAGGAYLFHRLDTEDYAKALATVVFLLAFVMACIVVTFEVSSFWSILRPAKDYRIHMWSSLAVLWAVIAAGTAGVLDRNKFHRWNELALACYGVSVLVFFGGLVQGRHFELGSKVLIFNAFFPARLAVIVALWWGGMLIRRSRPPHAGNVLTVIGHGLLTILLAVEMIRWADNTNLISSRMAVGVISALWALQAFVLVWLGLFRRNQARRVLGFALFGLTVAKVCFYDLSTLERVYQIVSFLGSGLLLVGAGYFYQRYSPMLLEHIDKEEQA